MVLGLVICEVLEDEVAHLLASDAEIEKVTVIESDAASDAVAALRLRFGDRLATVETASDFRRDPTLPVEVLAAVLRVGLHMDKKDLQVGVKEQASLLDPMSDVLLLAYGLCGNALLNIEEQLADLRCPIVMPTNTDGSKIDDCVCLVLGGTEKYLENVFQEAGTWFVTPGWLKHWETLLLNELRAKDVPMVRWIFEKAAYKRVLKVNTGIENPATYRAETEKFADLFGFYVQEAQGSLHLLEHAFAEAKLRLAEAGKED